MKHLYLAAAASALLVVSPSAFGQSTKKASASSSVSDALIANEHTLLDSVAKGDVKTFSALIAPGAGSVDEGGFMAVADFIKVFNQVKVETQTPTNIKVVSLGPNAAIVAYTLTQKGTFQGQPLPPTVYATTTWVKRGGKWLAMFHQESTAAKH
jgi:hypothetical protein